MFTVESTRFDIGVASYDRVGVEFLATTSEEASALYKFFSQMIGTPIDPYNMKTQKLNRIPAIEMKG